ncbi:MAG: ribosomal protein S18-alanine N-acetyltransferase [Clostridia bacterium]|nr:ribosomal protein S18-alanine N-acetyltransferase [Clostridia bacterium]
MDIKVIDMTAEHTDALYLLETICFSHPWTRQDFMEELDNENAHFLTAICPDGICGYIGVQEICGEGYITNVAVFPEFRRCGVAAKLISKALDNAKQRDCEFLSLEVRKSNIPAINLYKKLGFTVNGERKNFYRDPDENAILMINNLRTENV